MENILIRGKVKTMHFPVLFLYRDLTVNGSHDEYSVRSLTCPHNCYQHVDRRKFSPHPRDNTIRVYNNLIRRRKVEVQYPHPVRADGTF